MKERCQPDAAKDRDNVWGFSKLNCLVSAVLIDDTDHTLFGSHSTLSPLYWWWCWCSPGLALSPCPGCSGAASLWHRSPDEGWPAASLSSVLCVHPQGLQQSPDIWQWPDPGLVCHCHPRQEAPLTGWVSIAMVLQEKFSFLWTKISWSLFKMNFRKTTWHLSLFCL